MNQVKASAKLAERLEDAKLDSTGHGVEVRPLSYTPNMYVYTIVTNFFNERRAQKINRAISEFDNILAAKWEIYSAPFESIKIEIMVRFTEDDITQ